MLLRISLLSKQFGLRLSAVFMAPGSDSHESVRYPEQFSIAGNALGPESSLFIRVKLMDLTHM
jgi:hypothetical protein